MLSYVHRRCYGEPTEPADRPILEDDDTASWWSIRGFTARKYTEIVDRVLAKATPAIGEYLFSYLSEDPDPESAVVLNWRETWPDIEADLKAKLRTKLGVAESDMLAKVRALRLRGWVEAPPSPQSRPFGWLRARLLHSCFPAEEDPNPNAAVVLLLLNCTAAFQLCNWVNLARWALIDRTDEYQLVSFIIANKAYHFVVYGFIQLFQNTLAYMDCVLEDVGDQHPCSDNAPGRHIGYEFEFVMEMIRMATALWAYALLRRSRGDKEQIIDLERRRLKLEPGSEPAEMLAAALRRGAAADAAATAAVAAGGGAGAASAAAAAATAEEEEEKRGGILLRYMLMYDVGCWALCYSLGFVNAMIKLGQTDCSVVDCTLFKHYHQDLFPSWSPPFLRDWRFWMTLDFSQTTYSLLLLPYVLLSAPAPPRLPRASAPISVHRSRITAELSGVPTRATQRSVLSGNTSRTPSRRATTAPASCAPPSRQPRS